jgi:hypothetical protein
LRTTDGGINWAHQESGTSTDLVAVAFVDNGIGTVVGILGTILRTSMGGEPIENPGDSENKPTGFALRQNYPNPFNPNTTIRFDVPVPSIVHIAIYDVLGREVTTLVNESLAAGTYSRVWDASGLASGVYLYHMRVDDFVETRKLVLVR